MEWFIRNRPDLSANVASMTRDGVGERRLLAICRADRLRAVLAKMLDETSFSPRTASGPCRSFIATIRLFCPSTAKCIASITSRPSPRTGLFGGNSNWRGPVWFPVNYLLIESLQKFHHYHGDDFQVEFPTGSGNRMNLGDVAAELSRRLARLFVRDENGDRPVFGGQRKYQDDPHFRDHILFYEYFHGDNGAGLGASHQTGWTSLVAKLIQQSGA